MNKIVLQWKIICSDQLLLTAFSSVNSRQIYILLPLVTFAGLLKWNSQTSFCSRASSVSSADRAVWITSPLLLCKNSARIAICLSMILLQVTRPWLTRLSQADYIVYVVVAKAATGRRVRVTAATENTLFLEMHSVHV
jgi:hypothetical protein